MDNNDLGYIYIYQHEANAKYNVVKLGKTRNPIERLITYTSGCFVMGSYVSMYKMINYTCDEAEKMLELKLTLDSYHVKNTGGNEFYSDSIIYLIESYFTMCKIKFEKLSDFNIKSITDRAKKIMFREGFNEYKDFIPRKHQNLEKINKYFEKNSKGYLFWAPGTGKTDTSVNWCKANSYKKIIIAVPSDALCKRWEKCFKQYLTHNIFIVNKYDNSNRKDKIKSFMLNDNISIIITTLILANEVVSALSGISIDALIIDEFHHLSGKYDKPSLNILKLKASKQLCLTATRRVYKNKNLLSNDNEEFFGKVIDNISIRQAIELNVICDYRVVISHLSLDKAEEIKDKISSKEDLRFIIAAYMTVKALSEGIIKKPLIYSNEKAHAKIIHNLIQKINNEIFHLNLKSYCVSSDDTRESREEILNSFVEDEIAVISSVYVMGEGVDYPCVDCEVFAENMISLIRIVQAALRGSRIVKDKPDKLNYVILPILGEKEFTNGKYFESIIRILKRMVKYDEGLTYDDFSRIIIANAGKKYTLSSKSERNLIDFEQELFDEIKFKVFNLRDDSKQKLRIEYEKCIKHNKFLHINSIKEYHQRHDENDFYEKDPENKFNEFFTNWYDFLGIKNNYMSISKYNLLKNKLNILSYSDYEKYKIPYNLPDKPIEVYGDKNCIFTFELE